MERRRKWQPTPVPLPGKFHGLRSLIGYSPWGCKESDTTEWLHFHFQELAKVTGELTKKFFFIIIIFNWRMIALQCCVAFCQSTTWISHKYMYVSSLPPTEKLFIMIWLKPLTGLAALDKDDFMSGPQPSQTLRSGIRDGFGWRKGFPCSSVSKESACSAGDPGSIPGLGRSPGEGNGNPLQYPCLENLMERSLVGCSPWGRRVRHDWATNTYLLT